LGLAEIAAVSATWSSVVCLWRRRARLSSTDATPISRRLPPLCKRAPYPGRIRWLVTDRYSDPRRRKISSSVVNLCSRSVTPSSFGDGQYLQVPRDVARRRHHLRRAPPNSKCFWKPPPRPPHGRDLTRSASDVSEQNFSASLGSNVAPETRLFAKAPFRGSNHRPPSCLCKRSWSLGTFRTCLAVTVRLVLGRARWR
jgi:hypothetical protein